MRDNAALRYGEGGNWKKKRAQSGEHDETFISCVQKYKEKQRTQDEENNHEHCGEENGLNVDLVQHSFE